MKKIPYTKFCEKTGAWLDGYVKEWLDHAKDAVAKKWDYVILVDGVEGSGKSGLAITCAYYLDRSFSHERIVFTPEQFLYAVDNANVGEAIVWDEFVLGGLSGDAMTKIQKTIIKKMVTIRKKRLYIFLLIPYFFMLSAYFGVGRTRLLMHTYSDDGIGRGKLRIYNYQRKKDLYFKGKKYYDYLVPPTRRAKFGNAQKWGFIDWDAYENKKDEATASIQIDDGAIKRDERYKLALGKLLHSGLLPVSINYCSELLGISERQLERIKSSAASIEEINNRRKLGSDKK